MKVLFQVIELVVYNFESTCNETLMMTVLALLPLIVNLHAGVHSRDRGAIGLGGP